MGKNKLKKFAEMENLDCVLQYPWAVLKVSGFPHKGKWRTGYFSTDNPITLELGCGKGEYTVALSRKHPDRNFIGIDIKGARMWKGAKEVAETGIRNAAFLRTDIELLEAFFAPGEINEIWITFPDPQMQKTRKRLTSPRFLNLYNKLLIDGGKVHLKTDSPFLYAYTKRLAEENKLEILDATDDLYGSGREDITTAVKTFYEQQWLSRGKKIKYIAFRLRPDQIIKDVDESDIERDDYHSYPRGIVQNMPDQLNKL